MADSNSNSYDIINNYSPKIEVDSESEREYSRRDQNAKCKLYWTTENTIKLIETMEKECRELWDAKNPLNRDRNTRQAKLEYLAEVIGTTSEEISRKVHNLPDEEEEFGAAARAHVALLASNNSANGSPSRRLHKPLRVAASAPLPLPPSANPLMWPEEPTPRIRPGINADECQIFGDFVASELRTLRSHESRKRLKRMIQKAILQIGEEEDVNMISG
ncbi:hypothetical protein HF086_001758 [Spodoptera exigua]|uniref:MADF domain-containing protein n=1 Tax=Spodoptera exigua TaxID=7107 RepID=A0A922SFF6_SPOEX|nr:hypothetical protein HF086_001758 [Spodoptera exigua]